MDRIQTKIKLKMRMPFLHCISSFEVISYKHV